MVYNINEECFKSNEFLELIKNRKNTFKINQNLICLEPEIKTQNQDTLSIFINSTTHVTPNCKQNYEKGFDIDNRNDKYFFTEESNLNTTNKMEIYKNEENDMPINISKNKNEILEYNTANEPSEDIILEKGKVIEFLNCGIDIISNQSHTYDNIKNDLHMVDAFENEFWGNIYMITRTNTLYNKKIPFIQKHMERDRKNDSYNDFEKAHRNKRVTFDEKSNSYVFINDTKILDKSSANVSDSNNKKFSLQIYTQPTIQITDLSRYLYEKNKFRNLEKETFTDIQVSTVQLFDKIRNKDPHLTINEYDKNMMIILNTTEVTATKDICVIESLKDFHNHLFTEINEHIKNPINYGKNELLALPYYK